METLALKVRRIEEIIGVDNKVGLGLKIMEIDEELDNQKNLIDRQIKEIDKLWNAMIQIRDEVGHFEEVTILSFSKLAKV